MKQKKLLATKPAPVNKQRTIQAVEAVKPIVEEPPPKKKKYRRNVVNVACTEYDVVKKVARRTLNARLRQYEEDHEGAVVNNEGNKRLNPDWDLSWHDLTITADFLSKM